MYEMTLSTAQRTPTIPTVLIQSSALGQIADKTLEDVNRSSTEHTAFALRTSHVIHENYEVALSYLEYFASSAFVRQHWERFLFWESELCNSPSTPDTLIDIERSSASNLKARCQFLII